jgi:hypothetical protein
MKKSHPGAGDRQTGCCDRFAAIEQLVILQNTPTDQTRLLQDRLAEFGGQDFPVM